MQLFSNGLIAGSLAALIAGGLALVYGTLGVFNLALGQMVLAGGYATWWLHQNVGLSLPISIVGGIAIGAAISWMTFEIFIRPFYKRHRFLPLVTTISLSMILDALILLLFEERPRSILASMKDMRIILGASISTEQIMLILITCLLLAFFAFILHCTAFGRKLRAVVQNDFAAMSLGIPVGTLHRLIFIGSGVLAACAGIFIGIDQNLSPLLAFPLTIKAYAAVIAGGKGNFWGAVTCAYIIAFLEQLVVGIRWFGLFYIPAGYQDTVALVFIILFLLFKPAGLFGSQTRTA
ncbi:MAG: branched-chain amino acid ABC transporter permease [Candidatus Peribacteraceae bacterium]|nr:branched-chain amino acid ABC transporter permease [Candidatus Peribacteraceae bacterium]